MSDILNRVPLNSLRVFEAAARFGSYTRAAEALGMTQAAVSWQIRSLETRLEQTLFHRVGREMQLTSAGERLADAAGEAMAVLRAALDEVTEGEETVLAITTLQTLASLWLAPRLGGFQLAHPRLAVRLDTSARPVDLRREGMDIAIRAGNGDWPGLESIHLMPALITPLCTPDLVETLSLDDPEALINAPRVGADEEWQLWFAQAGLGDAPPPSSRFQAETQMIEVASALGGRAVALGSPIFFAADLASGRLVQPFETVASFADGYWLAWPAERRRTAKIAAFRTWILEAAAHDSMIARHIEN
ncbi:LysR substrate-binding domain-containing protein [Brevundimonas aveniformis]|uniref:LysR substrate-binding domain-containing protein n=1 Tax=Brevundimonas aveniformis TaxID=370977 RepID=UPI00249348C4|nr:LysR substrate-binding domain-containing protein [Brevundimonas aveniformis]